MRRVMKPMVCTCCANSGFARSRRPTRARSRRCALFAASTATHLRLGPPNVRSDGAEVAQFGTRAAAEMAPRFSIHLGRSTPGSPWHSATVSSMYREQSGPPPSVVRSFVVYTHGARPDGREGSSVTPAEMDL